MREDGRGEEDRSGGERGREEDKIRRRDDGRKAGRI